MMYRKKPHLCLGQEDVFAPREISVVFGDGGHLGEDSRLVSHCHLDRGTRGRGGGERGRADVRERC